jgi:hypothetical protein
MSFALRSWTGNPGAVHLGKFVVKSERCIAAHWKWRRDARV